MIHRPLVFVSSEVDLRSGCLIRRRTLQECRAGKVTRRQPVARSEGLHPPDMRNLVFSLPRTTVGMPNSWPGEFISEAVISIVASVKSGGVRGPGSTGPCRVLACDRVAHLPGTPLCKAHGNRWRTFRRANAGADLDDWCRREKQVTDGRRVYFAGVHPHVRRQLLFGVYNRSRRGARTRLDDLQRLVDRVRWLQATDLNCLRDNDLAAPLPHGATKLLNSHPGDRRIR